jgi:hypothetical protein
MKVENFQITTNITSGLIAGHTAPDDLNVCRSSTTQLRASHCHREWNGEDGAFIASVRICCCGKVLEFDGPDLCHCAA